MGPLPDTDMNKHNFIFFNLFLIFLWLIMEMIDMIHPRYYYFFGLGAAVLVIWRRYHLKMKPYWGGYKLSDFKRYFTEP